MKSNKQFLKDCVRIENIHMNIINCKIMLTHQEKGHWPLLETEKISLGWETHRMRAIKLVTGGRGQAKLTL